MMFQPGDKVKRSDIRGRKVFVVITASYSSVQTRQISHGSQGREIITFHPSTLKLVS